MCVRNTDFTDMHYYETAARRRSHVRSMIAIWKLSGLHGPALASAYEARRILVLGNGRFNHRAYSPGCTVSAPLGRPYPRGARVPDRRGANLLVIKTFGHIGLKIAAWYLHLAASAIRSSSLRARSGPDLSAIWIRLEHNGSPIERQTHPHRTPARLRMALRS
jgi:hypothetical protein